MNRRMRHPGPLPAKHRRKGFTLLEVVIALGLVGLLAGMVFRLASSSMQLSQTVVERQNEEMERNAFFNLLKNHFEQIPGNAVIRLEDFDGVSAGSDKRNLFRLTFQNVPMSFNWGDTPMTAEAIELATVEQRDGFVDVVLRFYDEEILDDSDSVGNDRAEPVAEITLIEDMDMCECQVVDGRNNPELKSQWYWDLDGRLPLLVKFYCRFSPSEDIVQQTFWVVPKQNPEVIFRQIIQQNPAGPQGDIPGGGGDQIPPVDIVPGGGRPGTGGTDGGVRPPTGGRGTPAVPGGGNSPIPIPGG